MRLTRLEFKVKLIIFYFSNFLSNSLILFYLEIISLDLIILNTTSFLTLEFINLYIEVSLKDSKYRKDIDKSFSNSLSLKKS